MANEAYRVTEDVSIPRAIREIPDTLIDGQTQYETRGVNYKAGDVIFVSEMSPPLREVAEDNGLNGKLEPISREEAEAERQEGDWLRDHGTFIPEHEAEARVMEAYGHEVVGRDVLLELNSQGAEEARDVLEAVREEGLDDRPNLSSPPTPDLATAAVEGTTALPEPDDEEEKAKSSRGGKRSRAKANQRAPQAQAEVDKPEAEATK